MLVNDHALSCLSELNPNDLSLFYVNAFGCGVLEKPNTLSLDGGHLPVICGEFTPGLIESQEDFLRTQTTRNRSCVKSRDPSANDGDVIADLKRLSKINLSQEGGGGYHALRILAIQAQGVITR
jgi:hypothetical protein